MNLRHIPVFGAPVAISFVPTQANEVAVPKAENRTSPKRQRRKNARASEKTSPANAARTPATTTSSSSAPEGTPAKAASPASEKVSVAPAAPRSTKSTLFGRTLGGKYLVQSFLGGGAMAAVYRARDERGASVAIKVMNPSLAHDPDLLSRFRHEAKLAAALSHPHVVGVIDYGEEKDGLLYIVMELVEGRTLAEVMAADGPLPPERAAELLVQMLSAVAAAHDLRIVHRDLKPENVLVCTAADGTETVKVCDFGVAALLEADGKVLPPEGAAPTNDGKTSLREITKRFTSAGTVVGTPAYMSPEQASGRPADARSDLYALGVMLYEMLTGRLPFEARSSLAMMEAQIWQQPIDPFVRLPSCHVGLAIVAHQAMQKDPAARFGSARAMRTAVRRGRGTHFFADETMSAPRLAGIAPSAWSRSQRIATPVLRAGLTTGWSEIGTSPVADEPAPVRPRRRPVAVSSILQGIATFVVATTVGLGALVYADREGAWGQAALATEDPAEPPRAAVAVPPRNAPLSALAPSPTTSLPALETSDAAAAEPPRPAIGRTARVVAVVERADGVTTQDVDALLARVSFVPCYHAALLALGRNEGGTAHLHLDIDRDGVVQGARARIEGPLASASSCLEARPVLLRVAHAPNKTGASAEVVLNLAP